MRLQDRILQLAERYRASDILAAHQSGDWHRFYELGDALLQVQRQRDRRAARQRRGDALNGRIRAFVEELPGASVSELVEGITRAATCGGDPVLADFDGQLLSFDQGGRLTDVSVSALRRRVQRIKRDIYR